MTVVYFPSDENQVRSVRGTGSPVGECVPSQPDPGHPAGGLRR